MISGHRNQFSGNRLRGKMPRGLFLFLLSAARTDSPKVASGILWRCQAFANRFASKPEPMGCGNRGSAKRQTVTPGRERIHGRNFAKTFRIRFNLSCNLFRLQDRIGSSRKRKRNPKPERKNNGHDFSNAFSTKPEES